VGQAGIFCKAEVGFVNRVLTHFGKCSDAVFAGEIVCVDGPQFSSLASLPALCYQRYFLKRAFRKTGRITK